MQKDRSGWILGIGIFLFFLGGYFWNSYTDIFERRTAYLYHPDSDRLYAVAMAPSLNQYKRWEPFVPFSSLFYTDPDGGQYLGKLQQILSEVEADRKLSLEDFDAWMEKHQREIEMILNELGDNLKEGGGYDLVFWYVEYYPRHDIEVRELLPSQLKGLQSYSNDELPDLVAVDAVVVRRTIRGGKPEMEVLDPEVEVLEKTLLIRGRAAYAMSEMFQ